MDYNAIKMKLENVKCAEHNEFPTISVIANGLNVKCCCDNFKNELAILARQYGAEQVKDSIRKSFGK